MGGRRGRGGRAQWGEEEGEEVNEHLAMFPCTLVAYLLKKSLAVEHEIVTVSTASRHQALTQNLPIVLISFQWLFFTKFCQQIYLVLVAIGLTCARSGSSAASTAVG